MPTTDETGPPVPPLLSLGAGGYEVLDYGEHDRIVPGVAHATIVRSTRASRSSERVTLDAPVPTATGRGGGRRPCRSELTGPPARLAPRHAHRRRGPPARRHRAFRCSTPTPTGVSGWVTPSDLFACTLRATATAGPGRATRVGHRRPGGGDRRTRRDVHADGPVVAERTSWARGRRLAMGIGIPLAEGAVVLAPQRGGGLGPAYALERGTPVGGPGSGGATIGAWSASCS